MCGERGREGGVREREEEMDERRMSGEDCDSGEVDDEDGFDEPGLGSI